MPPSVGLINQSVFNGEHMNQEQDNTTQEQNSATPPEPEVSDAAKMIMERLTVIENRMDNISTNGTAQQQEQGREVAADIPEVFEITPRDGEPVTLTLHHPSFYKLEFVADEVEAMLSLVKSDENLMTETGVGNFFLRILGRRELRDHVYKVLQIVLDPLPDPDMDDLSVSVDLIKLLNPAEVIDALVRKSTPFFIRAVQIFKLSRENN